MEETQIGQIVEKLGDLDPGKGQIVGSKAEERDL